MGAATFVESLDPSDVRGNKRVLKGTLTLSASYATSGDTLPDVGLRVIDDLLVEAGPNSGGATTGYSLVLSADGTKVLAYDASAQVTATTDLSNEDFLVQILGTD